MNSMHKVGWMTGMVATLLALGCASAGVQRAYRGEVRAPAELATIWGSTNQGMKAFGPGRERISITAVDDESTAPFYTFSPYPRAVSVLPGRRKLGIRYEFVHGTANGSVWADAQARHTYRVKVMNPDDRTARVYFIIEDITAQSLVGGAEENTK